MPRRDLVQHDQLTTSSIKSCRKSLLNQLLILVENSNFLGLDRV